MRIIDAHHHLWDTRLHSHPWLDAADAERLPRVAAPEDWSTAINGTQVMQSVCVQAGASYAETRWLLSQARTHPAIAGIVIQHRIDDPAFSTALGAAQGFAGRGTVVGVRDPAFMTRSPQSGIEDARTGTSMEFLGNLGLPLDVLAGPDDLPRIAALARAHPGTVFIVDHLGRPPLTECALSRREWGRSFADLGSCPNVFTKVSGLPADHNPRTSAAVVSAIRWAVDCLTPDRLMFGSDWPVTTPVGGYPAAIEQVLRALADLAPAQQHAIFADTAQRAYGLSGPRPGPCAGSTADTQIGRVQ
jgi:L-fuconolactonase